MIIKEIKGNVFEDFEKSLYDILVHGSNCWHVMSGGIAAIVSYRYPQAFTADKQTPRGSRNKLGLYSRATTEFGTIINLYTQFDYGTDKMNVDYDAIRKGFTLLNEDFNGSTLCIPKIGNGLGGGDWDIISSIINEVTPDLTITVYYL